MKSDPDKLYRLCPKCSYFCRLEETAQYCPSCGAGLIDACPHCHAPIDNPYARYCKHCGSPYPGRSQGERDLEPF